MIRRAARAQIKTLASDKRARGGSSGRTCASRTLKSSIPTWTGVGLSSGTCSRMQVQCVGVGVETSKPEGQQAGRRTELSVCQGEVENSMPNTHTHTPKKSRCGHTIAREALTIGAATARASASDVMGRFNPQPTTSQREEPTSGRQGSRGKRPLNCCRPTLCL